MTPTPHPAAAADLPEALTASTLVIGQRYNWRGQPERLIYLGMCEPRNGRWHQFANVDAPQVVWCEVLAADLGMLEATPDATPTTPQAGAPDCATCNDNGLIGGPSYSDPGEGGVPCPDCAPAQNPELKDAYDGAREDLLIWKRRALEAEATVRNFVREVNGPMFMGEPAATTPHAGAESYPLPNSAILGREAAEWIGGVKDGYISTSVARLGGAVARAIRQHTAALRAGHAAPPAQQPGVQEEESGANQQDKDRLRELARKMPRQSWEAVYDDDSSYLNVGHVGRHGFVESPIVRLHDEFTADFIAAANPAAVLSLLEENEALAKKAALTVANPLDTTAGPEGAHWYCESHPDQLMSHSGCGGAGITAATRIPMLLNQLRLARQEIREAGHMRDEMAGAARRLVQSATPAAPTQEAAALPGAQDARDAARYRYLRATTNFVTSGGEREEVRGKPDVFDAACDHGIERMATKGRTEGGEPT